MLKKIFLIALGVVLLVGLGVSIDLTYIHYKVTTDITGEYQSFCNLNESFNCDAVAQTRWARFLGVPIALFGALTYLFCLALVWVRWRNPTGKSPHASIYLLWISVASVLYSIYLAYVCYAEIGSWCVMCLVLYGVNVLMLPLSIALNDVPIRQHYRAKMEDLRWVWGSGLRRAALVSALVLLVALIAVSNWHKEKVKQELVSVVMSKLQKLPVPLPLGGESGEKPAGKVVLTVFSDYQCPHCKVLEERLDELARRYPQLQVQRRDFPLDMSCNPLVQQPFHTHACQASLLKNCAAAQGKGDRIHHYLLENQRDIGDDLLKRAVTDVGLDQEALDACMGGDEARFKLRQDITVGIDIRLEGTPALIINGTHLMMGGLSRDELVRLIEILSES